MNVGATNSFSLQRPLFAAAPTFQRPLPPGTSMSNTLMNTTINTNPQLNYLTYSTTKTQVQHSFPVASRSIGNDITNKIPAAFQPNHSLSEVLNQVQISRPT
jgi:hypothetical protein